MRSCQWITTTILQYLVPCHQVDWNTSTWSTSQQHNMLTHMQEILHWLKMLLVSRSLLPKITDFDWQSQHQLVNDGLAAIVKTINDENRTYNYCYVNNIQNSPKCVLFNVEIVMNYLFLMHFIFSKSQKQVKTSQQNFKHRIHLNTWQIPHSLV
jgi:hypothetical protein